MHRTLLNLLTISLSALAGMALLYTALAIFQEPDVVAAQATDESAATSAPDSSNHGPLTSDAHNDDDDDDEDDEDDDDEEIVNNAGHDLVFTATVGTDPHQCADGNIVAVTAGTDVIACFRIHNLGSRTYVSHTLRDDLWGLMSSFTLPVLTPAGGLLDSFFVTGSANLATESLLNTLSWIVVDDDDERLVLTDTIEVIVPQILLSHTVGVHLETCALTNVVNVMPGTLVTHCYRIKNISDFPFVLHNGVDSQIGSLSVDLPYPLEAGDTYTYFATQAVTTTSSSVVSWTATTSNGLHAFAFANAQINVPEIEVSTTVGTEPGVCASTTAITVTVGESVTYCYLVQNLSAISYNPLFVTDTLPGGNILLHETLLGNDVLYFTLTAPVTQPLTNIVTWTVQADEGLIATDIAAAQVNALSRLDVAVYYDVDRNRERHELEAPVPAILIMLADSEHNTRTATTDEQGIASFIGLANGEYQLSIPALTPGSPYTLTLLDHPHLHLLPQVLVLEEVGQHYGALPLFKGNDADCDGDGVPDYVEGMTDLNGDGVPDYCDSTLLNLSSYLPIVRN